MNDDFMTNSLGYDCYRKLMAELAAAIANYKVPECGNGLTFEPYVDQSIPGIGFESVIWETRPVEIRDEHGKLVFIEDRAEFPVGWDDHARRIVAQKYFYGDPAIWREYSLKQLIFRVSARIAIYALKNQTFASSDDATEFYKALVYMQLNQEFAFNSPVYFNVGIDIYQSEEKPEGFAWCGFHNAARPCPDAFKYPQISACFIQSVEDSIQSIMSLATSEAILFKRGSGTGTNLSPLRSRFERLSGGGKPSGPLSFMRVYDAIAGVIKSGGICLAPYQQVYTASGPKPVRDLAETDRDFTVLSFSRRLGRIAAKRAHAWQSGEKPVVAVETDKGEFHVSFDHPFMLKTGEIVRAENLVPGTSLFAVTTQPSTGGYIRVGLHDGFKGRARLHQLVVRDMMGVDPTGFIVHHRNNNKFDNEPGNLEIMSSQSDHASMHGRERAANGSHVFQQNRYLHSGASNGMHQSAAFWQDDESSSVYREKQRAILTAGGRAVAMQASARRSRMMNLAYQLINSGYDISTFNGYVAARKAVGRRCPSVPGQIRKFEREFGSYESFYVELCKENHRVVSVRPITLMPVYSVEVFDAEPDDKRIWSEHNYMLAPIGSASPFVSGVLTLNTRRAAKMQILNVNHPDIMEFIDCKFKEEQKARALIAAGYDAGIDGEAYSTVAYQNANLSVRVSDHFMDAATVGGTYKTFARKTGEPVETLDAGSVLDRMADRAWHSGDPGIQYDDTCNLWNTVPNFGRNNATNPCLIGDTLVDTASGRVSIADLAGMDLNGHALPFVFAFDHTKGMPVLRRVVRAWQSGLADRLAVVETDKGCRFECTLDHRFILMDGSEVVAASLKPGMRLRKIGRAVNRYRSGRYYINHRETNESPNGTVWQNRFVWEQIYGPVPRGFEVHHLNNDPTDDRIENLALRPEADHQSEHSSGPGNGRFIDADTQSILDVWDAIESGVPNRNHGRPKVTVGRWNKHIRDHGFKGVIPLARMVRGEGRVRGMTWGEFSVWVESERMLANDRVSRVSFYSPGIPVPVYDIEVEGVHNFAITCEGCIHSIIVHNCGEFNFVDDTACNLASLNMMKFREDKVVNGTRFIDVKKFRSAIDIAITAMETLVDAGSYPTSRLAENSHKLRPLGLGYSNVGAYIMSRCWAYDSDDARMFIRGITALLTGRAYRQSAVLAQRFGPFDEFDANHHEMMNVIGMHFDEAADLMDRSLKRADRNVSLFEGMLADWQDAHGMGHEHGFRNAQATCIAPTGTISFMMGCDTLGIEPDIALVRYKMLAGGGVLKLVNRAVPETLYALGYNPTDVSRILDHIDKYGTVGDVEVISKKSIAMSVVKFNHRAVFDCAFPPIDGHDFRVIDSTFIRPSAHVEMMGAAQPFVSGSISKTVNMPESASVDDIKSIYIDAWRSGCKCIAVYRDGSKGSQPIVLTNPDKAPTSHSSESADVPALTQEFLAAADQSVALTSGGQVSAPVRERLPDTRHSVTHKFAIVGHEGYITVGFYENGKPGEVFVKMAKQGSTVGGLMDMIGVLLSLGLQYGVPISKYVEKLSNNRFEPSGITTNPNIPFAQSILDYVGRWLGLQFVGPSYNNAQSSINWKRAEEAAAEAKAMIDAESGKMSNDNAAEVSGNPCPVCGSIMVRQGMCDVCFACGYTPGGCGG